MLKSAFDLGLSKHSSEASIPSVPLWGRPSLFTGNAWWHVCHSHCCFTEDLPAASVKVLCRTSVSFCQFVGVNCSTSCLYDVIHRPLSHLNNSKKFMKDPSYTACAALVKWFKEFLFLSLSLGNLPTRWQVNWVNCLSSYKQQFPNFSTVSKLVNETIHRLQWISSCICNWFCWLCTLPKC